MKASERSAQIWAVLAWAARGRQNLTYSQLARPLAHLLAGWVHGLNPSSPTASSTSCLPLPFLLCNRTPGCLVLGLLALQLETWRKPRQECSRSTGWNMETPGAETLDQAAKTLASNGVQSGA